MNIEAQIIATLRSLPLQQQNDSVKQPNLVLPVFAVASFLFWVVLRHPYRKRLRFRFLKIVVLEFLADNLSKSIDRSNQLSLY
jgi:hypothetical protein